MNEQTLERFLNNPNQFHDPIIYLTALAQTFPDKKEELFNTLMANQHNLLTDSYSIKEAAQVFSDQQKQEQLFQILINNAEPFLIDKQKGHSIPDRCAITLAAETFQQPHQQAALFKILASNLEYLLIGSLETDIASLKNAFPTYKSVMDGPSPFLLTESLFQEGLKMKQISQEKLAPYTEDDYFDLEAEMRDDVDIGTILAIKKWRNEILDLYHVTILSCPNIPQETLGIITSFLYVHETYNNTDYFAQVCQQRDHLLQKAAPIIQQEAQKYLNRLANPQTASEAHRSTQTLAQVEAKGVQPIWDKLKHTIKDRVFNEVDHGYSIGDYQRFLVHFSHTKHSKITIDLDSIQKQLSQSPGYQQYCSNLMHINHKLTCSHTLFGEENNQEQQALANSPKLRNNS